MKLDMETQDFGQSDLEIAGTIQLSLAEGMPASVAVAGTVTVDNMGSRFLLSGIIQCTGETECSRCLCNFDMVWPVPVDITVLRDTHKELEEGETLVIQQRQGVIDLSDAINECVVLALPQSTICMDDCKGLCSQCGVDKNKVTCDCIDNDFDPRWEGLPE